LEYNGENGDTTMIVTISRTSIKRMTDMYILRLEPYPSHKYVVFTQKDWEKMFPDIVLKKGEKISKNLHLTDLEKGV